MYCPTPWWDSDPPNNFQAGGSNSCPSQPLAEHCTTEPCKYICLKFIIYIFRLRRYIFLWRYSSFFSISLSIYLAAFTLLLSFLSLLFSFILSLLFSVLVFPSVLFLNFLFFSNSVFPSYSFLLIQFHSFPLILILILSPLFSFIHSLLVSFFFFHFLFSFMLSLLITFFFPLLFYSFTLTFILFLSHS